MSTLTIPNEFEASTVIVAADMNANFTAIDTWSTAINNDNIGELTGTLTWGVITNVLSIDIATSSTAGAFKIANTGVLASSKAVFLLHDNSNSTAGDALLYVHSQHAGTSLPAVLVNQDSPATGIQVDQAGAGIALDVNANTAATYAMTIDQLGNGGGLQVDNDGTGIAVDIENASTGAGISVENASTGTAILVENASTGGAILVENASTGVALEIEQASTGVSIDINDGTDTYAKMNASGEWLFMGSANAGWVSNLGFKLDSGLFEVVSADGTDLSVTNPGYVVMHDKTSPGQFVIYRIVANQGFIDVIGASEIIDNLFGTTAGVAHSSPIPFFVYAVANDAEDTVAFMLSRDPSQKTSPIAADIGAPDDAVALEDSEWFSFDNIDEDLYNSNPCLCIGAISMYKNSSDDWRVSTLSQIYGIGKFCDDSTFTHDRGHYGAELNSHFLMNGGSVVPPGTVNYVYRISRSGYIDANYYYIAASAGTGAVDMKITLPMTPALGGGAAQVVYGSAYVVSTGVTGTAVLFNDVGSNQPWTFIQGDQAQGRVQLGDFANTGHRITMQLRYSI